MSEDEAKTEHTLYGMRANEPLAFLASLGVLRALDRSERIEKPQLSWSREGSNRRPTVHISADMSQGRVAEILDEELDDDIEDIRYTMSKDGEEPKDKLANVGEEEFRGISQHVPPGTREEEAIASYGTDAFFDDPEGAEFTAQEEGSSMTDLNLLDYSGPLRFLKTQRNLVEEVDKEKIYSTLYEPWDYSDDGSGSRTMRWSPVPGRSSRGAYTGVDPTNISGKPAEHGANRLAIEGSRLFTVVPDSSTGAATCGFVGDEDGGVEALQYPLWSCPVSIDTARTLITHPEVATEEPDIEEIPEVDRVMRSEIEVYDRYRNLGRAIPVQSRT